MAWDVGDTVPLTIEIVDAAGAPAPATGVVLTITDPDGVTSTPSLANPQTGRYSYDFVPAAAGLYRVMWRSTSPATAWGDVLDVRPALGGVISLADAKQHLNKSQVQTIDDEELRPVIAAAIERVDRHLWTKTDRDAGSSLTTRAQVSASEVLAVKTVLDVYWAPQRSRLNRTLNGGGGPAATELDSGPAGAASLTSRLTELLGLPAEGNAAAPPAPSGSYPDPSRWPDPIEVCVPWRWWL
jgi:hypothetical protein